MSDAAGTPPPAAVQDESVLKNIGEHPPPPHRPSRGVLNDQNIVKKKEKQLEKEAKFAAKKAAKAVKASAAAVTGEKKAKGEKGEKKKKESEVEQAPFVNTTPKGEKKGAHAFMSFWRTCSGVVQM